MGSSAQEVESVISIQKAAWNLPSASGLTDTYVYTEDGF